MSQDLDVRLKTALAERDRLVAVAQRIAGQKEAAEKALTKIEEEIREKNLDPATLDDTIAQLRDAFTEAVATFERDLEAAREALAPYMEKQ